MADHAGQLRPNLRKGLKVSKHAVQRFQERVANLPEDQVRRCLLSRAIRSAAAFGAPYVRLGTGQRVVIHENAGVACVVTVLPRGNSITGMSSAADRTRRRTQNG